MNSLVWQEQFQALGRRTEQLARRSLVDLALAQRHECWDVEALDSEIQSKGIEVVIAELRAPELQGDLSTMVLADALEETAMQLEHWDALKDPQRFLTLWRDRCWQYGWDEPRRQCEGLLFDYRWPSIQRVNILHSARENHQHDPTRIRIRATLDGSLLLDVDHHRIDAWDPLTGELHSQWGAPSHIRTVLSARDSSVLILCESGELFEWNALYDQSVSLFYVTDEENRPVHVQTMTHLNGKVAVWGTGLLSVWGADGECRVRIAVASEQHPQLCFSVDGQRVLLSTGRMISVWSALTGRKLTELVMKPTLDPDQRSMMESILDSGRSVEGLLVMDRLDLWGLSLATQYDLLQSISIPFAVTDNAHFVIAGDGTDLGWLEWSDGFENYMIASHLEVGELWGVRAMQGLAPTLRQVVAISAQGIVAWDFARRKEAHFPLPMAFSMSITVLPESRLIAVDNGVELSLFRFVPD